MNAVTSVTSAPDVHPVDPTQVSFAHPSKPKWYLAYGSNLNSDVFLKRRKISPLEQKVVFAKGLELTFDINGPPYLEPRFANSRIAPPPEKDVDLKDPWTGQGCLLGVAYLVTPEDFRTIIVTEGGGSSYQPVLVDSHVVAEGVITEEIIQAYTLISTRIRPSPAQPTLRYMTLLRKGARGM
jgi:hypothetical protein